MNFDPAAGELEPGDAFFHIDTGVIDFIISCDNDLTDFVRLADGEVLWFHRSFAIDRPSYHWVKL